MSEKHIHKYKRVRMSKKWTVYKCVLPDCPHYVSEKLVVGRRSICWRCNAPFLMTSYTATLASPHCKDCTGVNPFQKLKEMEVPERIKEVNELETLNVLGATDAKS